MNARSRLGDCHTAADPWAEIAANQPRHAAFRPRIHRQIVLVADKEDADAPDGIAIVRLEPDKRPKVLARASAGTGIAVADALVARLEMWNPWGPASYRIVQ